MSEKLHRLARNTSHDLPVHMHDHYIHVTTHRSVLQMILQQLRLHARGSSQCCCLAGTESHTKAWGKDIEYRLIQERIAPKR